MESAFARNVWLVGRGVLLETARRKEFWVLSIFAAVFAMGVMVVRSVGIENADTAKFVVNLGLSLALGAAHLLTILATARQVPSDLENRTIYPILAKPVDRLQYLVGKWWACSAAGIATLLALSAIAWVPAPPIEGSAAMLVQAALAGTLSVALTAAMTLLFSLLMPQAANIVVSGLVVWFGDKAAGFLTTRASGTGVASAAQWVAGYVPDFSRLNLVTRYTDGIAALAPAQALGLALYALILLLACHAGAYALFRRRAI